MRSAFVLFPQPRAPIQSSKVDFDQQFTDSMTRVIKIILQIGLNELISNPDTEKQPCQKISKKTAK